ncbi:hypothetical protein [Comamonas sp. JC664]|uniref:hypothetical protein n=1 Tax=Comamonas sp. JC664 TaxID=2801917 RepID=UPI00174E9C09|nr:hypothetical protein [Comamonas sp. JC664]
MADALSVSELAPTVEAGESSSGLDEMELAAKSVSAAGLFADSFVWVLSPAVNADVSSTGNSELDLVAAGASETVLPDESSASALARVAESAEVSSAAAVCTW